MSVKFFFGGRSELVGGCSHYGWVPGFVNGVVGRCGTLINPGKAGKLAG